MSDVDTSPVETRAEPLAWLERAPAHKRAVFENAERMASQRDTWIEKNAAYYRDDRRYLNSLFPKARGCSISVAAPDRCSRLSSPRAESASTFLPP